MKPLLPISIYLSLLETAEDKSLFEYLYLKHKNLMFHIAFQILQNDIMAEDAVHQAFLKVIPLFNKIGDPDSSRTKNWLSIIVRNISINERNRRNQLSELEQLEYASRLSSPEPVELVADEYGLKRLIDLIPLIYRDILQLVVTYGIDYKTISQISGISQATARKRFERAKKMMKELLKERGEFKDEFYPE